MFSKNLPKKVLIKAHIEFMLFIIFLGFIMFFQNEWQLQNTLTQLIIFAHSFVLIFLFFGIPYFQYANVSVGSIFNFRVFLLFLMFFLQGILLAIKADSIFIFSALFLATEFIYYRFFHVWKLNEEINYHTVALKFVLQHKKEFKTFIPISFSVAYTVIILVYLFL